MKNLLFVHLESLNYINYRMNSSFFPTLYDMEKKSISFTNYFSTSTSTLMTIGDLLYGGREQYESSITLDDVPSSYFYKSSLFDDLKSNGYQTGIFIYPDGNNRDSAEEKHLSGFDNHMILKKDYEEYLSSFEEIIKGEKKFALMACNYISNSSFNQLADPKYGQDSFEMWEIGYRTLDLHVRHLLDLLKKYNKLENTIILFYGDHGDDYWTHSFRHGMTHAIEPNAFLIHTPMFIYDYGNDYSGMSIDHLAETTDLREIISSILRGNKTWVENILENSKNYIFSRSAYAAQPVGNIHYYKGYAICDGTYLFMVTSDGMGLYHIKMEQGCHNNLLHFFRYNEGMLVEDREDPDFYRLSKWGFWQKETRQFVRQKFYYCRELLYKRTLELYIAGGKDEKQMNQEMDFYHILNFYED